MARLKLHLLGTPRIELDGNPINVARRKALALLAYVALTQLPQRRDTLAALFWPDYDQTSARANLRRTLSVLNNALHKEWLEIGREQIALKRNGNFWLDVDQFHHCLTAGLTHNHPARELCPACVESLARAAELYRGDLLTGFSLPDSPEFEDWQLFQTESLRRELAGVLEKLVRGHSARNEFEPAVTVARRWLALDSLEEAAHRCLMRVLTLSGQRNAALAQYRACRQILADELGVEPTAETTALYQQIREGELVGKELPSTSLLPSSPAPRHNLPPQPTSFIGRATELAEIDRLILREPDCRLLTLVGPGGVGKTRLALQAAADSAGSFAHGVCFVALAPINAAESLIPTIAAALNFPLSGGDPKTQLLNYLRPKNLLLLLDNFEHLIAPGVSDWLVEIVRAAPQVALLVTSRERLHLQAEWGFEVRGMHYPQSPARPVRNAPPPEEINGGIDRFDAVQLFVQRAQRARPEFVLSAENRPEVARICRLVEGTPLGIELAAAWLRMMSCREVAAEIERSVDFLTTSLRDVPERHRSLRGVFEHSWRLLSDEEQAVFRKLSVFRGGFRRRAAERVANATLPLLSALVDKSLLRRTRAGRYQTHELLRQFAGEKLNEVPGECEQTRDRHSDYYLTFLQQRQNDLKGRRLKEALEEISTDIDNVRAAWRRAITQKNVVALSKSQESLFQFYDYRGWYQEGETTFGQAVERIREEDEMIVLAQLLRGQGLFSARLDHNQGIELIKQSVALLRRDEREPQQELAFSTLILGWATHIWSEFEEAELSVRESLTIYTRLNDEWGIGCALTELGYLAFYQGQYTVAEQYLHKSISTLNRIGIPVDLANALIAQARIAQIKGDYEQAGQYLRKALQISREFEAQLLTIVSLRELGYLTMAEGDYLQAQEYLQESIDICNEVGDRRSLVNSLDKMGVVSRLTGAYEQAKQLHRECLTIAKEIDYQWNIALSFNNLGRLAYVREEYRQAEQYHRESLAIWRQLDNQREIASVLSDIGYAIFALERARLTEAEQEVLKALEIATEIGARPVALNILTGWAALQVAGQGDSAREQAVEWLALARHHPAAEQETRDRAARLLDNLVSGLPPEAAAMAQERGKLLNLDSESARILGRCG